MLLIDAFLKLEDVLAEVAASLLQEEGIGEFGEREGAVCHRVSVDGVDAADQVLLIAGDADNQSVETLLPSPGVITPEVLLR